MATQKFSELTTTATPNSASVFAIAYSGTSYGVTLANIAANLPAVTATTLTSSGTLTVSGNATISGDLTVSGDDITMNTNTSGAALIADGTNFNPVVISGDIAIAAGGAATIQADAVEGSMLNDNVISGQTEITSGLADADELLYSDAGVLKKVGMDTAKSYFHSSTATAITVADESSDTTCFPLFVTAATGDLAPKSGDNLSFNSATGALTATSFVGTAPTPTVITVADESSDTTCFPLFVTAATGDLGPKSAAGLTFNSSSDTLTATAFSGPLTGNVTGNASGSSGSCTGLAATATALASARTIGGVSFDGTGNINLPGVNTAGNQDTSGTAADATVLETARNIGGVSFNGSANIDLPGVNAAGNQATSGLAATATALASARTIGGVSFDGTGNIDLPGVNTAGNQNTSGTAAGLSATLATGSGGTGLTGAVVGKQTIWIPAAAMYPNTTAGCAALAQVELSNGPEIKVLDFDASTDENAQFTVCFPKLWNEGTVTFQAFFTVTGTNTGTVAWGLSAVAFADSGDINTAFGTNVVATAKAHSGTSNDLDVCAESGAVTIAGSPSVDEMVFFQIMRDISADDQTGDARLLGIKLFFTTDALTDA